VSIFRQQMDVFRTVVPLHTAQPPYNLFERSIERDVLRRPRQNAVKGRDSGGICGFSGQG